MEWLLRFFRRNRVEKADREIALRLAPLERSIDYRFRRKSLLIEALKHRSILSVSGEERYRSNERLEFLGDSVLDFVVAQYFYDLFPTMGEGELTKLRSVIASGSALVRAARRIHLGEYILLSPNEERTGGRERASILEDSFEALVGAIYLDGNLEAARDFVEVHLLGNWREIVREREFVNYKSLVLEHAQANQWPAPEYVLREESGPDHSKRFVIELIINGEVLGRGEGRSKKAAEQEAACNTATKLGLLVRSGHLENYGNGTP